MSHDLVDAMANMRENGAMQPAQKMLDVGEDPLQVLERCRAALEIGGQRFEAGKYYLPEPIMAGEMLKKKSQIAKPFIEKECSTKADVRGKVVIGSVKGDIHNIGKNIVTFMRMSMGLRFMIWVSMCRLRNLWVPSKRCNLKLWA
jgi:methanogenic corrinoid protein MtbC1